MASTLGLSSKHGTTTRLPLHESPQSRARPWSLGTAWKIGRKTSKEPGTIHQRIRHFTVFASNNSRIPDDTESGTTLLQESSVDDEIQWGWFNWEAYNQKFDVPWNRKTLLLGMLLWIGGSTTVAVTLYPLFLKFIGSTKMESLVSPDKITFVFLAQAAETLVGLAAIFLTTGLWKADPSRSPDIMYFSLTEPLEKPRGWLVWGGLGMVLSISTVTLLSSGLQALGNGEAEGVRTVDIVVGLIDRSPQGFALLLVMVGVMAPVHEEVVFRGFLLASLSKWIPTYLAVGISSLIFASAHLTPSDIPLLFAVGVVWGFMYVRSRNLATTMLVHSLWNSSVLTIIYVVTLLGLDLPELVALVGLGTRDKDSEANDLAEALACTGWPEFGPGDALSLFERFRTRESFTLTEVHRLLCTLDFSFRTRKWDDGEEKELQHIASALANGESDVPSLTLTIFLCFILNMQSAMKLQIITTALKSSQGINHEESLSKEDIRLAIPHFISVSHAASVLMDPSWDASTDSFGSLSSQTTRILLSGIADVTFDSVVQNERQLRLDDIYSFMETCAKRLSDLMLQQTLLEQEVFRASSTAEHRTAMHFTISQSRQLLERYVPDMMDMETVMNDIWKSSVDGYQRQAVMTVRAEADLSEMTSAPESSSVCPTDFESVHLNRETILPTEGHPPVCPDTTIETQIEQQIQPQNQRQELQNQNAFFEALGQVASDLGQRVVMLTLGRFMLFLALLYGTGAFGFAMVQEFGWSIAVSLSCTAVLSLLLAATALYCASKGCRQVGDEASRNIYGALQSSTARAAVDGLVKDNAVQGLQPMVKNMVESLVPERSHGSMIPFETTRMTHSRDSEEEQTPTSPRRNRSEIVGGQQHRETLNRPSTSTREVADDSVASRLRGIVTTVGKIAAHFNQDVQLQGPRNAGHGGSRSQVTMPSPVTGSSGLELQRQTTEERFFSAYPHMRENSA